MYNVSAITIGAVTTCLVATLCFKVADASAGSIADGHSAADTPRAYVVRFADLDLSSAAGTTALHARLRGAAEWVCAPLESRALGLSAKHKACMDKAMADAVASIHHSLPGILISRATALLPTKPNNLPEPKAGD
jgi:UrcA family protein